MKDMIERIIELDKAARENANEAKQLKVDLDQKISDLKERRRKEYFKRAKVDMKEKEKDEKIKACIKLSAIEGIFKKKTERVEKIYAENKEEWISTIVQRVKSI